MVTLGLLVAAILLSLAQRVMDKKRAYAESMPEHATPSPLSDALKDLIGLAGGIYLSLVLLVSFLQIDVPDTVNIIGLEIDPLAFSALVLAVLQPVLIRAFDFLKKGGK